MEFKGDNRPVHPQSKCAWCGSEFKRDEEPFGVGASLDDRMEGGKKGEFMIGIELEEAGKTIYGLLPPPGSPARESGHDIWFMVCGEECAHNINEHIEGGIEPVSPDED